MTTRAWRYRHATGFQAKAGRVAAGNKTFTLERCWWQQFVKFTAPWPPPVVLIRCAFSSLSMVGAVYVWKQHSRKLGKPEILVRCRSGMEHSTGNHGKSPHAVTSQARSLSHDVPHIKRFRCSNFMVVSEVRTISSIIPLISPDWNTYFILYTSHKSKSIQLIGAVHLIICYVQPVAEKWPITISIHSYWQQNDPWPRTQPPSWFTIRH